MITRRNLLQWTGWGVCGILTGCASAKRPGPQRSVFTKHYPPLIGYSRYRTNLPGGRYANTVTTRAWVVSPDGRNARPLAEELTREPGSTTQFAGWSPDGRMAIIGRGWESPENGAWEEENKTFRFTEGRTHDMYLLDMETGELRNLTEVERVSHYNPALFFIPGDSGKLGFQAMVGDKMHPFIMDLDGRNKRDLIGSDEGFAYGYSASPNGRQVAYHKDYQIYVGPADGSPAHKIETGNPFNFAPLWSPNDQWLMFLSGERTNCDPYIVRPDGSGLRKVASRNGYKGFILFLDVYDFHEGSSDTPIWDADGKGIYYTTQMDSNVELMWASLDGKTRRLTQSPEGALNYHPRLSANGRLLAFGSNRSGTRQLYVRSADPRHSNDGGHAVTNVEPGWGAMWAQWRP